MQSVGFRKVIDLNLGSRNIPEFLDNFKQKTASAVNSNSPVSLVVNLNDVGLTLQQSMGLERYLGDILTDNSAATNGGRFVSSVYNNREEALIFQIN